VSVPRIHASRSCILPHSDDDSFSISTSDFRHPIAGKRVVNGPRTATFGTSPILRRSFAASGKNPREPSNQVVFIVGRTLRLGHFVRVVWRRMDAGKLCYWRRGSSARHVTCCETAGHWWCVCFWKEVTMALRWRFIPCVYSSKRVSFEASLRRAGVEACFCSPTVPPRLLIVFDTYRY